MYIYGVLCAYGTQVHHKKRGCPKDIAAPHQGVVLRVPREAGEKEKDRAEPSLLWAGDTAGNHRLISKKCHHPRQDRMPGASILQKNQQFGVGRWRESNPHVWLLLSKTMPVAPPKAHEN
jgi:hypothetical protein